MIKIARASPADFPDTDNIFQTFLWGKIKQQSGQIPHYFWVTAQYENDENSESKNHPLVFPLMVTEAELPAELYMLMHSVLRQ